MAELLSLQSPAQANTPSPSASAHTAIETLVPRRHPSPDEALLLLTALPTPRTV